MWKISNLSKHNLALVYFSDIVVVVVVFVADIGDIAGVAETTIRQAYKLMFPKAHDLFPEDFKFFTPIDQLPSQWKNCIHVNSGIAQFDDFSDSNRDHWSFL